VLNEEQVEEIVQEAVSKTEKSFGGTFKRLKSENEELKKSYETAAAGYESAKKELETRIGELESRLGESKKHISELAVRGELERQLRIKGSLPEKFIELESIEYSDDPEMLSVNVSAALDRGRRNLETALKDIGLDVPQNNETPGNPTNPPRRDTKTAQDLKNSETKDVLRDMARRGLIR